MIFFSKDLLQAFIDKNEINNKTAWGSSGTSCDRTPTFLHGVQQLNPLPPRENTI